jgi:uncharacterized membrane protein
LLAITLLAFICHNRSAALCLAMPISISMNQALALMETQLDLTQASKLWTTYPTTWQFWNVIRKCPAGLALLLTGAG